MGIVLEMLEKHWILIFVPRVSGLIWTSERFYLVSGVQ
jgi:hypothetical protein